jgi:hypothetical protein
MGVHVIGYASAVAGATPTVIVAIATRSARAIPIPIRKTPVGIRRPCSKTQTLFLGTTHCIGSEGSPLKQ